MHAHVHAHTHVHTHAHGRLGGRVHEESGLGPSGEKKRLTLPIISLMRAALIRRSCRLAGGEALALASLPTTRRSTAVPSRKRGATSGSAAAPAALVVNKRPATAKKGPKPGTKKAGAGGPSRDMEQALWAKGFARVAGEKRREKNKSRFPILPLFSLNLPLISHIFC